MLLIFFLTFNVIGAPLQSLMELGVNFVGDTLITFLTNHQVAPWLISLLEDGVIAGVGSVLSFLPLIVVLFFFLSMLEDSGYMARVAFVMDKLLRNWIIRKIICSNANWIWLFSSSNHGNKNFIIYS